MKRLSSIPIATLVLSTALGLWAPLPGQSRNLGKVDFPTSGSPAAQEHFLEGVLYLHNFEFEDAREEFQKAQQLNPGFAMAYWGESLTYNHALWRQADVAAGRKALEKLAPTLEARLAKAPTPREKDFLASLEALWGPGDKTARDQAYHDALAKMYEKYSGDHEVASLYALSILGLTNGTRDFRNYMRAASIVEMVFGQNPQHPGAAHYMIHSYDDPIHAPLGLRAAATYAKIAPAASHAQHMVSHIYVALGQWDEAVQANEQAWEVSNQRRQRKRLGIGQLDFHSYSWLHYSYLQQGRYQDAHEMLETVVEVHRSDDKGRLGSYYNRMRAGQVIESRDWNASLPPSLETDQDIFADALVALGTGHIDKARLLVGRFSGNSPAMQIMKKEMQALLLHKTGKSDQAIALLTEATAQEEGMALSYGPPNPMKPSHELLGEILLELGRPEEAVEVFQKTLERAPRRALSLLGLARAAKRSGQRRLAHESYSDLVKVWHRADPRPELREARQGAAMPLPADTAAPPNAGFGAIEKRGPSSGEVNGPKGPWTPQIVRGHRSPD